MLRFRDVRVIGAEGEQLGILQSRQALNIAREAGLDLVMVSPTAVPPVCKIIDYGRHKYEEKKLKKEGAKNKSQEVKGIKVSPRIAEHDIEFNLKKAIRFLEEGHKVRMVCMFRAREVTHPELGRQKLDKFAEGLKDLATVERTPVLDGRQMVMVLVPKPSAGKQKNAKAENKQDGGKAVQDHRNGEDHETQVAQQPPVLAQESVAEATA